MTASYAFATVVALLACHASAQEACDSDASVTGFNNITSLNRAMRDEVARIAADGTPQDSYSFVLCPNTIFDTSRTPLRPILDAASFTCGADGSLANQCTFNGGDEQIRIVDSRVPGYQIKDLSFSGITFEGFTPNAGLTGASINALARSRTTATFEDVEWKVSCTCRLKVNVLL